MLGKLRCAAQIAVQDLGRARQWYFEALGLEPALEETGALHYLCGGGTGFTVYESPSARASGQTVMGWLSPDLEAEMAELRERGVRFESYDLPGLKTDENGVAQIGADRVAWFRDDEGNVLALGQSGTGLLEVWEEGRA